MAQLYSHTTVCKPFWYQGHVHIPHSDRFPESYTGKGHC
uniref:Uncharacterized protein n=1 Tax=Anguilla anguilla TaxID=7936 RepID=A0A0E9WIK9_ANGAN